MIYLASEQGLANVILVIPFSSCLRYPMLMTNQTMTGMTLLCWVVAHIFSGISTINLILLPFCGPNQIVHAFCETISLSALVCQNPGRALNAAFAAAMFILYVPLALIVLSYVCIIVSVMRMASAQVSLMSLRCICRFVILNQVFL